MYDAHTGSLAGSACGFHKRAFDEATEIVDNRGEGLTRMEDVHFPASSGDGTANVPLTDMVLPGRAEDVNPFSANLSYSFSPMAAPKTKSKGVE